jgi:hypothetical protein
MRGGSRVPSTFECTGIRRKTSENELITDTLSRTPISAHGKHGGFDDRRLRRLLCNMPFDCH